ncbi:MAG: hypothetical protein KKF50_00085 [Nanoarchaeota archaeon]|nr:hypothetical protein [Nanoarchaeota archaeon]
MKNHGGYGGQGDYSFETEKPIFPNALDIIANIAYIPIAIYKTTKKILTAPARGLEKLAKNTIKDLGGFEEDDLD